MTQGVPVSKFQMMTKIIGVEQKLPPSFGVGKIDMGLKWVGPNPKTREAKIEKAKARFEQLLHLDEGELRNKYNEIAESERVFILARMEADEAKFFYNQPNADADFDYWAKMSTWTINEAVALTFGKDPRVVHWDKLKNLIQASRLAPLYRDRLLIFNRAVEMKQIYNKTIPINLVAWMKRMQIDYPTELEIAITELGIEICDWKSLYESSQEISETLQRTMTIKDETIEKAQSSNKKLLSIVTDLKEKIAILETSKKPGEKSLSEQERQTLLKLIAAMAVRGYRFDPKANRNAATGDIQSDLDLLGISLDQKTILKLVREATKLITTNYFEQP